MKIRELKFANCLSYGSKGLNKDNLISLSDINLFIGCNNSGKSNMLRMLELIQYLFFCINKSENIQLRQIPLLAEGAFPAFIDWIYGQDSSRKLNFDFALEIEEVDKAVLNIQPYNHEKKNPVHFMFSLDDNWPKILKLSGFIEVQLENFFMTITRVEIPTSHRAYQQNPILFDRNINGLLRLTDDVIDRQVWRVSRISNVGTWGDAYTIIGTSIYNFLKLAYSKLINDLLTNIQGTRHIQSVGDVIAESLSRLRDGTPKERKLEKEIQESVKRLVFTGGNQDIELVYAGTNGNKQIKIQTGEVQLPLKHYGSSIEQMLVILTKIISRGNNKIVLIEEPEAHFHPSLQREFIRFLIGNQQLVHNQYLIATHSNIFIDELIKTDGSIFYVSAQEDMDSKQKYSQADVFNKKDTNILFRELGIKPSDLLFANGIVIVEGDIDKDVYTDWAKKLGKPFNEVHLEIIDVEGAGNISKYLTSSVIQRTCLSNYAICDKNAEQEIRAKIKDIVSGDRLFVLKNGDIEDYYPRKLVIKFIEHWGARKKNINKKAPQTIEIGKTVEKLNDFLGVDWWKKKLAVQMIEEMTVGDIHEEIGDILSKIYNEVK